MAVYLKKDIVGSGSFGTVWKCKRKEDGKIFAEKLLDDDVDEKAEKRFKREVRILSELDHPNVVKVLGKRLSKKPFFYIMPLYEKSLDNEFPEIVGNQERIIHIFNQVLDAIEYAHSQGVIHRDLKPQNILLNNDNDLVVSDFGLGRQFTSESTRQTQSGFGLGTPLYMAPEQFTDAKNASKASDIYALGRILLELYSEILSFGSVDYSCVPPKIEVVVRRCIDPDMSKRFSSVSDLKIAFQSIFDSTAISERLSRLDAVIARLSSISTATEQDAKILLEGLLIGVEDDDLIQNAVMSVTPTVFNIIESLDLEGLRLIIKKYVDLMTSQGWPFGFTDKIGSVCKSIFYEVSDFEVRANLIYCAVEVGASHNRWHVMKIAGKLLNEQKSPGEAIPIKERLKEIEHYLISNMREYVNVERLDLLLKPLFYEK